MHKGRLEAFSDAVIAIIMTIMVLELVPPHGATLEHLQPLTPKFIAYVLSFANIGIYWNNHHHMLQVCQRVSGPVLWTNLHLMFWLSLVPFMTAWMGENHFALWPVILYGVVLIGAAIAYYLLAITLVRANGADSAIGRAIGRDWKGKLSVVAYAVGIGAAFLSPWIAFAIYWLVALVWFVPDTRMERAVSR